MPGVALVLVGVQVLDDGVAPPAQAEDSQVADSVEHVVVVRPPLIALYEHSLPVHIALATPRRRSHRILLNFSDLLTASTRLVRARLLLDLVILLHLILESGRALGLQIFDDDYPPFGVVSELDWKSRDGVRHFRRAGLAENVSILQERNPSGSIGAWEVEHRGTLLRALI